MPTDTSQTTRGEGADEHADTEPGTTPDSWDTERVLVAPEQPRQPLQLYHQSPVDQRVAPTDCLSPQRQATLYRTERTLLETRIEALERTVEQRESQLDSVIEQYETILAEKQQYSDDPESEFDRDRATSPFGDQSGPVRGLLARLPTATVADRVRSAVRSVFER
jgi:hypothetical protein